MNKTIITILATLLFTLILITILNNQKKNLYKERYELMQERIALIHKTGWLMGVEAATYDNWYSKQDVYKSYTRDSLEVLQYFTP